MYPVKKVFDFFVRYDPEHIRNNRTYVECIECGARTESHRLRDHRPEKPDVIHCHVPIGLRDERIEDKDWKVYVFGPLFIERLKPLVRNRPYVLWPYHREWFGVSLAMATYYENLVGENIVDPPNPGQMTLFLEE